MRWFLPLLVPALLGACSLLPDGDGGRSSDTCLPGSDPLFGEWAWVSSTGGFAGWTLTPESEGYTLRTCFRPDSTFAFYRSDTLVASGDFSLSPGAHDRAIRYDFETVDSRTFWMNRQTVRFESDSLLHLVDPCCDLYDNTYRRVE